MVRLTPTLTRRFRNTRESNLQLKASKCRRFIRAGPGTVCRIWTGKLSPSIFHVGFWGLSVIVHVSASRTQAVWVVCHVWHLSCNIISLSRLKSVYTNNNWSNNSNKLEVGRRLRRGGGGERERRRKIEYTFERNNFLGCRERNEDCRHFRDKH